MLHKAYLRHLPAALLLGMTLGVPTVVRAAEPWPVGTLERVQQLAVTAAQAALPAKARVEVELGGLDSRLQLASCQLVEPYLPNGQKMWGRSRIGLRCMDGRARWNVTLPVTVRVFAQALVANAPLAAGTTLTQALLQWAEIDIAAESGAVSTDMAALEGRSLARPLMTGEAVRASALKLRQWFAAGETVKVQALGAGFAVSGEGQALANGMDGQEVRVRFESGRTVSGRAVGDRRVEVLL
ncbi:flagellar basal body P-ring formation chaperone FlgA [Paucibacter sp. APW11]|uniref:Flagella basal body P-ring formation protein FlgA n=1 Tax=Roseateles aquae TaxID=3077235 RepID=A0ABU3P9P9_9BURK|nr:flagellar basal body P-ring formation chaperone FlgA [Paucibacter sp. APW11]MDT8999304.1 flagellar basal body P-ring formation chaperone FlgA [Paucibacter sp. APW11]